MLSALLASYTQKTDDGYLYEELWTEYASSLLGKVFLATALFLCVALIVIGIFVKAKKAEQFSTFLKVATAIAVSFALTVIITMLSIGFAKIGEKGYLTNPEKRAYYLVLIPPMVLAGIAILGGIVSYICGLFSKKSGKVAMYITFGVLAAALIAAFVCLIVYFNKNVKNDGYYDTSDGSYGKVNQTILYLAAAILVIVAIFAAIFSDTKGNLTFDGKSLALAGICVAMSYALSYIKLWDLPQGGSVTLVSFLPIMLFAYIYGAKKGLFVGFVYGLLQSLQDPYIIHPAQYLLDYPIAFAMAGLAGVLKYTKLPPQLKFALSALIGGTMRYVSHVVSGAFAFGAYAIDAGAKNAFVYSAVYNSFVFVDILLVILAGAILFSSQAFAAQADKFAVKQPAAAENGTEDIEDTDDEE